MRGICMKHANSAIVARHEPEELPELVVADVKKPAPLNKRVASLWLWTSANDVSEGYDLMMSASFGKDQVTLKGGGFHIEVTCSLTSADIDFEFRNCKDMIIEEA